MVVGGVSGVEDLEVLAVVLAGVSGVEGLEVELAVTCRAKGIGPYELHAKRSKPGQLVAGASPSSCPMRRPPQPCPCCGHPSSSAAVPSPFESPAPPFLLRADDVPDAVKRHTHQHDASISKPLATDPPRRSPTCEGGGGIGLSEGGGDDRGEGRSHTRQQAREEGGKDGWRREKRVEEGGRGDQWRRVRAERNLLVPDSHM